MSENDRLEILEANSKVQAASSSLHIGEAVIANRNEYVEEYMNAAGSYFGETNFDLDETLRRFNRRVLNLCASYVAYVKHNQTFFRRDLSLKRGEVSAFDELHDQLREKFPYYSVMWGLRNFIQHVDIPRTSISISGEQKDQCSISVEMETEDLLQTNAVWGRADRKFLRSLRPTFSLWALTTEWDEAFLKLLDRTEMMRCQPALFHAQKIRQIRFDTGIAAVGGMLGMMEVPRKREDGSIGLEITWLNEKASERIILVCEKGAEYLTEA